MISALLIGLTLVAAQESEPEPVSDAVAVEAAAQGRSAQVEEELICRRKYNSGNKFGERNKSSKVCKTREEWEDDRRKR